LFLGGKIKLSFLVHFSCKIVHVRNKVETSLLTRISFEFYLQHESIALKIHTHVHILML